MILGMEIVWFIGFWCCDIFLQFIHYHLRKSVRDLVEDDMKINIGFQIDEGMLVFGFGFFLFAW